MATFDIKRFADVDALKRMQQSHLVALLTPFQAYFRHRGLALGEAALDHELLARILLTPDDELPIGLVDALYHVDEMATEEDMDALMADAAAAGVALRGDQLSPADVAVQVWLQAPELLERQHAGKVLASRRSFEYFQAREVPNGEVHPSAEAVEGMEAAFDARFEAKKRGRGCRVFVYPGYGAGEQGVEVSFLIRHGEPFKREGSVKGTKSSSVYYRPEKHDVVVYNQRLGELRVNAGSKGVKELYCRTFGRYLFDDDNHFPGTAKYTLEPLRQEGKAALACTDIEGVESVTLAELQVFWHGTHEIEIRKAPDLFTAMEQRKGQIHPGARRTGATFRVKFADVKTTRNVSIWPSNLIKVTRDDDGALIEQWLKRRGFILASGRRE